MKLNEACGEFCALEQVFLRHTHMSKNAMLIFTKSMLRETTEQSSLQF